MKREIKTIFIFSIIIFSTIALIALRLIFIFYPAKKRLLTTYVVHLFGKIATFTLGIKVNIRGRKDLLKKRGQFFICNHLSYIDGIVATGLAPLVFIAKADVRKWPFFGFFTFLSDTIFVNRTNPSNIQKEIKKMVSFLNDGINVILFPEGTSTNGEKLLPFKSSFFAAPLEANAAAVPLVITYKSINSQAINEKNRDFVYWYGSMPFLPHLLGVLKLDSIVLDIKVCEPLQGSLSYNKGIASGRKDLCEASWKAIEGCLDTTQPTSAQ